MRFSDQSRRDTLVRLVTDGLLLAEIQHDRLLRRYDTIIVDEAHERSLNIDFLLGYLHRAAARSAPTSSSSSRARRSTPAASATHFGDAPVVEVSGRTYPVEVRYRPVAPRRRRLDPVDAIGDAVEELLRDGARRRARLPLRRARDPRHGRGADRAPALGRRDPAALRAPRAAGAAARVQAARRAPRRPRDERRRDVADRPGHRLGRRPRHGADQPLQRAAEGPAAADRARLAGVGRPAQGPLRAHSPTASASACTPRRTSTSGPRTPIPRSCARASPR